MKVVIVIINLLMLLPVSFASQGGAEKMINAAIKASRTSCASPCTVVFSAESTTAQGLDSHGIWSQLSYYWDFGTGIHSPKGYLYKQQYSYVDGDTSFESGHVPMVTKTFLCDVGTCTYRVAMRAQNELGHFDDTSVDITVNSESVQWRVKDTICVSNTLKTNIDWSAYDKPCPAGAKQQKKLPRADKYNDKLILLRKGDVFKQNVATYADQSNFKVGFFGNTNDARPQIDGNVSVGMTSITRPTHAPSAASYSKLSNRILKRFGWPSNIPSNIYFEGLHLASFSFPMSYRQIGIHNIDMDRSHYSFGGYINVSSGADICHYSKVDCRLIPFPKGGYISSVNVVGSNPSAVNVNIVQTECAMVNFLGMTDVNVRRAREHNVRIAGWYRINIMRSRFQGVHEGPGKHKITLRSCLDSGGTWERGVWASTPFKASNWNNDVEGKTRADSESTDPQSMEFLHTSRYQVVAHNQLGDDMYAGESQGGVFYSTSVASGDAALQQDIIVAHNYFEEERGRVSKNGFISLISNYGTCVGNIYPNNVRYQYDCVPVSQPPEHVFRNEPKPIPLPLSPALKATLGF